MDLTRPSPPPAPMVAPPLRKGPSEGRSPSEETRRRPSRRRPRLIHSGDLWVVLVVVVMLVLLYTGLVKPLASYLYSPFAFVLIVVMCVEFLVLKARDRSRFYRMEIQLMRNRRREDIRLMRETSERLEITRQELRELRSRVQSDGRLDSRAKDRLSEVESELRQIEESVQRIHEEIAGR